MRRRRPDPPEPPLLRHDIPDAIFKKINTSGVFQWGVLPDGTVEVTLGRERRTGRSLRQAFGDWVDQFR